MRRTLTKNEYMLSALFAFIAAFPLATSADGRWFNVEPLASLTSDQQAGEAEVVHAPSILHGILGENYQR